MSFERVSYQHHQQQPARFDLAQSYHPRRVLQQMQPHQHAMNSPMAASQWTSSRPAAIERMALPALNIPTARAAAATTTSPPLPLMTMQRMTIQSPSVSDIVARNNSVAPGQSPANKKRVRALPNASKSITLDLLRPHFEKPLAEVAAMFGICMTLMKKICRKNGVPRWPHRQIRGLRKSIWSIEKALRCCESETQKRSYNDHLQKQRAKLLTILKGPGGPSRAAFDKILAEPCSPSFEFAASPASSSNKKKDLSVPFSLSSSSYDQFRSSPVSHGSNAPAVVRLPPIASLLHKKIPLQRTMGTFSGSFHF
ncbi:Rwp-rk domain-containing protein, partial [Globisporangium splendens]